MFFIFSFFNFFSSIIIVIDIFLESSKLFYFYKFIELKANKFNNTIFEKIASKINKKETINILTILTNIKLKDIFVKQVAIYIKKIISLNK